MIAGPERSAGRAFDRLRFNDKHPTTNPVTGEALDATPFFSTTLGFSADPDQPLPHLGLGRVFVLAGPVTCSASESIINGLRGIDVEVVQIGGTTCGKPYGFYPFDNCGTTYFSIQFEGVNDKGFGDYADGFSSGAGGGVVVPGCPVADDFHHDLGDPEEARLAAALAWRAAPGTCPASAKPTVDAGTMVKPPWRSNRLYRR
jgi:hypothetical protein